MHSLRPRCAFFWTKFSTGDCVAIYWTIRWNPFRRSDGQGLRMANYYAKQSRLDRCTRDDGQQHGAPAEHWAESISVVALRAQSNRLANTRPLMPALLALLPNIKPGTVTFLSRAA